jgi:catechol 2,3-dioxygenase-like lactoylglutathione lyase family enzyme
LGAATLRGSKQEIGMIRRCSHVGLTVSDLQRSMDFYRGVIGMEEEYISNLTSDAFDQLIGLQGASIKFCYLRMSDLRLQLIQYVRGGDEIALSLRHNKVGSPHICFWVDDVEKTFAEIRQRCSANIISDLITLTSKDAGIRTFYVADPDGVPIELCQPTYYNISKENSSG